MPSKNRRRREAEQRRREKAGAGRQRLEEDTAGQAPRPATVRTAPPKSVRDQRKRGKAAGTSLSPWFIAAPVVAVIAAIIVGVIIATSGGGPSDNGSDATDPRLAGLPISARFTVEAGGVDNDSFFRPNTITGKAGEVIEITIRNTSSVVHNIRVSGDDKDFNGPDDFVSQPSAARPGETSKVTFKMDQPGTYPFQCDFHPIVQTGTIVLQ